MNHPPLPSSLIPPSAATATTPSPWANSQRTKSEDASVQPLSRRQFLERSLLASASLVALPARNHAADTPADRLPEATPRHLPRWRGFNLLEKFNGQNHPFRESDFAWIAELGFNFVRLPMDYRAWIENNDWRQFREATFKDVDAALALGEKHGIHVMINFHRAPGYTVARPQEAKLVWNDPEALDVCTLHWRTFARRYQGIPNRRLSFNLFNEPDDISAADHHRVIAHLLQAIRAEDPKRLVICDGRQWGNEPPVELEPLGVAATTRGYQPFKLTHYLASWAHNGGRWEEPSYPLQDGNTLWNRAEYKRRYIDPWKALESRGLGVMVGEFGAYNKTKHPVVLDWLTDLLALWKEADWGWALWNFRGSFGILDSERADVAYESWRGHRLDRRLLDLLQRY